MGFHHKNLMIDSKININGWSPKNYKDNYLGEVSVQDAFSKSINTVAVKISENIGRDKGNSNGKINGYK